MNKSQILNVKWLGWASGGSASSSRSPLASFVAASGEFDEAYYRTKSGISASSDAIEHYLAEGSRRGIGPNDWFSPNFYLGAYEDVAEAGIDPFVHFLQSGRAEGRRPSFEAFYGDNEDIVLAVHAARSSPLFDEVYYRAQLPVLRAEEDAFDHYISIGWRHHISPSAQFDAIYYFSQHETARSAGLPPLIHYFLDGQRRRLEIASEKPFHWVDRFFADANDVHIERLRAAAFSYRFGLNAAGEEAREHRAAAINEIAALGKHVLGETSKATPEVSIVVPVYGQFNAVLNCLDSLAAHQSKISFEVLLMDDASPEADQIGDFAAVPWLRYIRGEKNRGFIGACNHAASLARGKYVVLLNSDTRLCGGWLDELIGTFDNMPNAGLVGSKLYNADGSLQEAGAIVWNDGTAWNYGRDENPGLSQYCYARETDYCSGAAIALPLSLWNELGGFDVHYAPAYYEDVDIAFRVRALGRQTWFQPLAGVIHYEGVTHGRDETKGVKVYQRVNAQKFAKRWKDVLETHEPHGKHPLKSSNRARKHWMLAMDALTPTPDRDAGSVMTVQLLHSYRRMGWQISFAPVHYPFFDRKYGADLQRVGIEVMASGVFDLEPLLRSRAELYETVIGFRVTTLIDRVETIRRLAPTALLLFHDIDLHYLRMQREADLKGDRLLMRAAEIMKNDEFRIVGEVDCSIVPSDQEKEILRREASAENVVLYAYTAESVRTEEPFDKRRDIAFIGGFNHTPNVDAVEYFVAEIWPDLARRYPDATFYVIGSSAPDRILNLAASRVVFTGFVEDLATVLGSCRVFVAPLRYGAGLKGKVVSALSYGVPCVATSIAVEGMQLEDGKHALVADDASSFIQSVMKIYDDEGLWATLRSNGYEFVDRNYSWEASERIAASILDIAEQTWFARSRAKRKRQLKKAALAFDRAHEPADAMNKGRSAS